MSLFYLDASAVVKRYSPEAGTRWIQALTTSAADHAILISEITLAEVAAALSAKQRAPGGITLRERDEALALFLYHCDTDYILVKVERPIIELAVRLTQQYPLRGYDAVQLATALVVAEILRPTGAGPLVFVTADTRLLAAARDAGLSVENPALYP